MPNLHPGGDKGTKISSGLFLFSALGAASEAFGPGLAGWEESGLDGWDASGLDGWDASGWGASGSGMAGWGASGG